MTLNIKKELFFFVVFRTQVTVFYKVGFSVLWSSNKILLKTLESTLENSIIIINKILV